MNIDHPHPEFARREQMIVMHVLQGEEIYESFDDLRGHRLPSLGRGRASRRSPQRRRTRCSSTQKRSYLPDDLAQPDLLKLSPAASAHCREQLEEKFERGCRLFARLLAIGQELAALTHSAGDLAKH